MRSSFLKGAVVGLVCALLSGATVALAGSGVGGVFNLGVSNSVDAKTTLTGASPSAQLQVTNTNATVGSSGVGVNSASTTATGSFANSSSGAGLSGNRAAGIGVFAQSGGAAKPALCARNTAGGPAGAFVTNAGVAPFTVTGTVKVAGLNADLFDGLNSTAFLRNQVPLSLTGSAAINGVITGKNTGSANGVQGESSSPTASGVYGQNSGGGFGVAGRSNQAGGIGVFGEALGGGGHAVSALANSNGGAVIASNQGTGPALELHASGAPISVDSSVKVDNLNADRVDGASILSNRIVSTTLNDQIIQLPGFGDVNVVSCNHTNAMFQWTSSNGPAYVTWHDDFTGDDAQGIAVGQSSSAAPRHFATIQLARDTGGNTSIATVTVTANGADCVFAAQAVVQPG
jgi:hypothetical protein